MEFRLTRTSGQCFRLWSTGTPHFGSHAAAISSSRQSDMGPQVSTFRTVGFSALSSGMWAVATTRTTAVRGSPSPLSTSGISRTCRRKKRSYLAKHLSWARRNHPLVGAVSTFAAGRGGRVDGKPNNNCAPDKLVAATGEFGSTARVPMLWIYTENDSYFGPELTKRMHNAFTAAGGDAEYRLLPAFGNDGHFMIDSADAVPLWAPLVSQFLAKHSLLPTTAVAQQRQLPTNSA